MRNIRYVKVITNKGFIPECNTKCVISKMFVRESILLVFMAIFVFSLNIGNSVHAQIIQLSGEQSCDEFLVAKKRINGQMVGQEDCLMREVVVVDNTWPEVTAWPMIGTWRSNIFRRRWKQLVATL